MRRTCKNCHKEINENITSVIHEDDFCSDECSAEYLSEYCEED